MGAKEEKSQEWTLEELADYGERGNELDLVIAPFFAQENSARNVAAMLNKLIREYNSRLSDSPKVSDSPELLKYKKYLYKLLGLCLPFMDTCSRMYAFVDRCILADDIEDKAFYDQYFRSSIEESNAYIESVCLAHDKKKTPAICFTMGIMNFKTQDYERAIKFLTDCRSSMEQKGIDNDSEIAQMAKCMIYLASSYEYKDMLSEALEQLLGVSKEKLHENLAAGCEAVTEKIMDLYRKIPDKRIEFADIRETCMMVGERDYDMFRVFNLPGNAYQEIVLSFVHVLAHCLSEFVSKLILGNEAEYPYCSLLQLLSRFLMDCLVSFDDSYVTCQATIRAENDACPEAIDLLLNQYESKFGLSASGNENEKEKAELEFYIFYFAEQELRFNYEDKPLLKIFQKFGNDFYKYAMMAVSGTPDFDSLFHYWVIQCKFLLKKYAKEALKSGSSVDYSELDNAILQLTKCKEKISKHVFKALISECDRLEKLYYFFCQFRYVNQKKNGRVNIQEFQILLEQGNYDLNDGYEANMGKLYHEIEKRNKILILAPVYESPSCSFSVKNVDELIEIQQEVDSEIKGEIQKVKNAFKKIGVAHSAPFISKKKFKSKKLDSDNRVKWAVYYKGKSAFLYYRNFRKIDGEYSKELFPLILTDQERLELNRLLKDLNAKWAGDNIECGELHTGRNHGGSLGCNTKLMQYNSDDKRGASAVLLNLLIFLEMDLISSNKDCRLEENDVIIFRHVENVENGEQYSIIVFPADFEMDMKRVCEWGEFEDAFSEDTLALPEIQRPGKSSGSCEKLRFEATLKKVIAVKNMASTDSQVYRDIASLEDMLRKCRAGNCEDTENRDGETCVLISKLMERGIEPEWI